MEAIIPAAGKGTRMTRVSGGNSKEMLMVGGVPVIEHVIREAELASCNPVFVVTHCSKTDLNEYLVGLKNRVIIVEQDQQNGLAGAVLRAETSQDAMILLGDTLIHPAPNWVDPDEQVSQILVQTVEASQCMNYGMIRLKPDSELVAAIVEKPAIGTSPSLLAVSARYFFRKSLMKELRMLASRAGQVSGELGLTELINLALKSGEKLKVRQLNQGCVRLDCGSEPGLEEARLAFQGKDLSR